MKLPVPSPTVARAAILWGAGILILAPAVGGLLSTPATVLYVAAGVGCLAAGRWLA